MHIEPGIVSGAKMALAFATSAGVGALAAKSVYEELKNSNVVNFALRSVVAAVLAFVFFEVLPHFSAGVSEVHFIFGTTLFLLLGVAPAALGLIAALLFQGMFVSPSDLSMYFVNVTTLLAPLFVMAAVARQVLPKNTAYADLGYGDVLKLSAVFQGGVIAWVGFWVFYGQGVAATNFTAISAFAGAYLIVVVVEPIVDVAALAVAKTLRNSSWTSFFTPRLFQTA